MEFLVKDQECIFLIDTKLYDIDLICKAAYKFTDKIYVYFQYIEEYTVQATFEGKVELNGKEVQRLGKDFCNELLNQKVRLKVSRDTKNIRELILGRALYSTCIEIESPIQEEKEEEYEEIENQKLDDIAITWFDKYSEEC